MNYFETIRQLARVNEWCDELYTQLTPALPDSQDIRPLTDNERSQVDKYTRSESTRWRPLEAERMTNDNRIKF